MRRTLPRRPCASIRAAILQQRGLLDDQSWLPAVAAPAEEMPAFIRGLHEGLLAIPKETLTIPRWPDCARLRIFSDFSDKLGEWTSYAFLCAPEEAVAKLSLQLADLRHRLGVEDGRRFEYKSLRDQKRWAALLEWLQAFDSLEGLAFILLVRRDVINAFGVNAEDEPALMAATIRDSGFGDWESTRSGRRLLEEALRILHSVAYLHAFLTLGGAAELHWVSDNDEIFEGRVRSESILRLLPAIVEKYSGKRLPVALTTEAEIATSPLRDLLSLPDLLAAAALEHQRGLDMSLPDAIAKAAVVLGWFEDVRSLQKLALRVVPHEDGGVWWQLARPYFAGRGEPG